MGGSICLTMATKGAILATSNSLSSSLASPS